MALVASVWLTTAIRPAHGEAPSTTASVSGRYDRAARFLLGNALKGIRNASVTPHWIGETNRFWYARETASGGSEFVVVDAATGAREPAFDANEVAKSLTVLLKRDIAASPLPFGDFEFSASGDAITFSVEASRIRCELESPSCAVVGPVPPPDQVVSPDGRSAVLLRDGNLTLRDLATGQERALTKGGAPDKGWGVAPPPGDFHALRREIAGGREAPFETSWSPDSKRVLTVFTDRTGVAPYPFLEYAPADGSFRPKVHSVRLSLVGEPLAETRLYSIEVATGAATPVDLTSREIELEQDIGHAGEFSADGRRYFLAGPDPRQTSASLFEIDLVTGKVRRLIHEEGAYPALLGAGPYDHANVAILDHGAKAIWPSQRDGWDHLYLYDLTTGRFIRQLTQGAWVVRNLLKVDEAAGQVYFTASGREGGNPYLRSIYRVGLDGRGLTRITPEAADKPVMGPFHGLAFDGSGSYQPISPSGRYIVYPVAPLDAPASLVVRRTDGSGEARVVEKGDASALFAAGFRPPEPFTVKAADGKSDLYGVVYRPTDFDPARRYPVLLAQYNSPLTTIVPRTLLASVTDVMEASSPSSEAELGLVVVMVDVRGTPLRGRAFSTPWPGYLSTMGLEDDVAALRQLGARDPSLDLQRLGITGASFGAWTTVRALEGFGEVFKTGVAWAPPGAFYNMYDATALTYPNGPPRYEGGGSMKPKPAAKPLDWASIDSIAQVGRIKGKLFLGSGGLDENVVPGSPMQFVDAAAKASVDIEPLFLPNATHGPPPYWPYVTRRIWDFLTLNLVGDRPPGGYRLPADAFVLPAR